MKKTLALLAVLLLALPLTVCAEDTGYIRQLPQNTYIGADLIAEESYPDFMRAIWGSRHEEPNLGKIVFHDFEV